MLYLFYKEKSDLEAKGLFWALYLVNVRQPLKP